MDMSTEIPLVGYFIYRSGEQSDPTTSLEFCPPKDSDELFFALKMAYPLVKTHSERMRNAVIEFLMKERDEEQTRNQMANPVVPIMPTLSHEGSAESPWSSWPSIASNSTLSSPDLVDLATPASMSPHLNQSQTMSRQHSQAQSSTTSINTPALEQMTGVFSLSSVPQPKTRVRRKMTESEKAEYRKRRIVKACDSCSKRKRKCNHNTTQLEKVASTSKVTKPKTPSPSTTASVARNEQLQRAVSHHVEPSEFFSNPFAFLDENIFSELPTVDDDEWLSNTNFDNLFAPKAAPLRAQAPASATAWPWSDTPDWTLLGTPQQTNASLSPSYTNPLFPSSTGLLSPTQTPLLQLDNDFPQQTQHQNTIEQAALQSPTRSWRTFSDFSRTAFSTADGRDGKEMPLFHSSNAHATGDTTSSPHSRPLFLTSEILTGPQSNIASGSTSHQTASQTPQSNTETIDRGTSSGGSSSSRMKQRFESGDTLKQHLKPVRSAEQTAARALVDQTNERRVQDVGSTSSEGGLVRTAVNAGLRTTDIAIQARSNDYGQLPLPRQRLPGGSRVLTSDSSQGALESTAGSSSPYLTTSSSDIATSALRDTSTAYRLKATRKRPATSDTALASSTAELSSSAANKQTTAARPARSNRDQRLPGADTVQARAVQEAISNSSHGTASSHQFDVPTQVTKSLVPTEASQPSRPTSSTPLSRDQASMQPSQQVSMQPSQQANSETSQQRIIAQGDWQLGTDKNPDLHGRESHSPPMESASTMTHAHVTRCQSTNTADIATVTFMQIYNAGQALVSALLQAMLTQALTQSNKPHAATERHLSSLPLLVSPV